MFDLDHEFFRPLWIRVAVTAVALGWALFEFLTGAPFWGVLFLAAGLWCCWKFFIGSVVSEPDKATDDRRDSSSE